MNELFDTMSRKGNQIARVVTGQHKAYGEQHWQKKEEPMKTKITGNKGYRHILAAVGFAFLFLAALSFVAMIVLSIGG